MRFQTRLLVLALGVLATLGGRARSSLAEEIKPALIRQAKRATALVVLPSARLRFGGLH